MDADITDIDAFDRTTSIGGVEYIIAYVTETWHCPVYFYSGAHFGDEGLRSNADPAGSDYERFVNAVIEAAEKWNAMDGYTVEVIDLYHDEAFNARVSDSYYEWCTLILRLRKAEMPMLSPWQSPTPVSATARTQCRSICKSRIRCQRRCDFVVFRRTGNVEKWRVNVYSP